ncbi:MAG: DUF4230 domain-containing protein [Adhaeribacter sp.]
MSFRLRRLIGLLILVVLLVFIWRNFKDALLGKPEAAVQVSHNTVLSKIEDLGRMELVRYNFKDVVEYKKELSRWLPDSRSVLIVAGEAVGCIDMSRIQAGDIRFSGDSTVTIRLPEPELCYFRVDHSKSRVLHLENTYFQDAELVEEGYKYAEQNVRNAALEAGILEQTAVNADKVLQPMLEGITGRRVILEHQRSTQGPRIPRKD